MSSGVFPDIAREQTYPTPYQNSPLLPLLLLSLATQKHTPDTRTKIREVYDYIIIGAGSAGSVVASRLSEKKCVSVLLLEAGKPPPQLSDIPVIARSFVKSDIDWDYETEPQEHTAAGLKNRQVPWPGGKALGGSSVFNAMLYIRGNPKNYDDWSLLGAKGWSWKNVFPYFLKLEDNQNPDMANSSYHSTGGPITATRPPYHSELDKALSEAAEELEYPFVDPNGKRQIGFSDFQASMRKGQRCSTAKAYLVPSENRTNLDIIPEAFVVKIVIKGNRAVGVLVDYKGRRHLVRAREEVICSAGAVNTAQLLMLSGIGPRRTLRKHNISVIADLPVGQNLQDHCAVIMNFVVNDTVPPLTVKITDTENIERYIEEKVGPLASPEGVIRLAFLRNTPATSQSSLPDYQLYFLEGGYEVPKTQLGILPSVYNKIYGPYENKTIAWCISSVLHPRSRGNVTIRSADPYDSPMINPNYLEHFQDVVDIVSGLKCCLNISRTAAMRRLGIKPFETLIPGCEKYVNHLDQYLECHARTIIFTLSHVAGTAKMGKASDSSTVVDPNLRVKGIHGLRVVDASVMPTVPSGNTNIPVIMIAEKASDMIKETIRCQ